MQNKYYGAIFTKLKTLYRYKYFKFTIWIIFSLVAFYELYIAINQIYGARKDVFVYGEASTKPIIVNIRKDIINKIEKRLDGREKNLDKDLNSSYTNPFFPYSAN